jgi:DtxR family Mn-dependent transcriptional regulator
MRTKGPTTVKEDYLRAIFRLQEDGVDSVRLVDMAGYLGLSRSTVSERVRELVAQGYVKHAKYGQLTFTRRGHELAKKLTHKHRMVEVFLHDVLKLSKSEAHIEAHQLEHALSDKVIKKLGIFLGNPTVDPHGSLIPQLR